MITSFGKILSRIIIVVGISFALITWLLYRNANVIEPVGLVALVYVAVALVLAGLVRWVLR